MTGNHSAFKYPEVKQMQQLCKQITKARVEALTLELATELV